MTSRRFIPCVLFVVLGLLTTGCAQTLGQAQPSIDAVSALREQDTPRMAVGAFVPGPQLPSGRDASVLVRSVNLSAPDGGSFAGYLQQTLAANLRAAGRLNSNSDLVIQGQLIDCSVISPIGGTGKGSLGADFVLLKSGTKIFEKNLSVSAQWDSAFIGAEGIPDAINQFGALYGKLAVTLIADPDFTAATRSH